MVVAPERDCIIKSILETETLIKQQTKAVQILSVINGQTPDLLQDHLKKQSIWTGYYTWEYTCAFFGRLKD